MKKEHFEYVATQLERSVPEWKKYTDDLSNITMYDLYVECYGPGKDKWWICDATKFVFASFETKEEADRILQLIKDTAVLFI